MARQIGDRRDVPLRCRPSNSILFPRHDENVLSRAPCSTRGFICDSAGNVTKLQPVVGVTLAMQYDAE
jgi:hypothetical protein